MIFFHFRPVQPDLGEGGGGHKSRLNLGFTMTISRERMVRSIRVLDFKVNLTLESRPNAFSQVSCAKSSGMTLATMAGVVGGVIFGLILRFFNWLAG